MIEDYDMESAQIDVMNPSATHNADLRTGLKIGIGA